MVVNILNSIISPTSPTKDRQQHQLVRSLSNKEKDGGRLNLSGIVTYAQLDGDRNPAVNDANVIYVVGQAATGNDGMDVQIYQAHPALDVDQQVRNF